MQTSTAPGYDYQTFELSLEDPGKASQFLGVQATYKVDQHLLRYEQVVDDPDWGSLALLCWDSEDSDLQRYGFIRSEVAISVQDHGSFDTSGSVWLPMLPQRAEWVSTPMPVAVRYTDPTCQEADWGGIPFLAEQLVNRSAYIRIGYLLEGGENEWGPVRMLLAVPFAFTAQAPDGDIEQIARYSFLDEKSGAGPYFSNNDGERSAWASAEVAGPTTDIDGTLRLDAFKGIRTALEQAGG